jgi:hypothetical protein
VNTLVACFSSKWFDMAFDSTNDGEIMKCETSCPVC